MQCPRAQPSARAPALNRTPAALRVGRRGRRGCGVCLGSGRSGTRSVAASRATVPPLPGLAAVPLAPQWTSPRARCQQAAAAPSLSGCCRLSEEEFRRHCCTLGDVAAPAAGMATMRSDACSQCSLGSSRPGRRLCHSQQKKRRARSGSCCRHGTPGLLVCSRRPQLALTAGMKEAMQADHTPRRRGGHT